MAMSKPRGKQPFNKGPARAPPVRSPSDPQASGPAAADLPGSRRAGMQLRAWAGSVSGQRPPLAPAVEFLVSPYRLPHQTSCALHLLGDSCDGTDGKWESMQMRPTLANYHHPPNYVTRPTTRRSSGPTPSRYLASFRSGSGTPGHLAPSETDLCA
jgi:hypothetical protein